MIGFYYYEGPEDYDDGICWPSDNQVSKALFRHHFINVIRLIEEERKIPCEVFFETLKYYIVVYHEARVKSILLKNIVSVLLKKKLIDLNYLSSIEKYLIPISEPLTDDKFYSVTYNRKNWFSK